MTLRFLLIPALALSACTASAPPAKPPLEGARIGGPFALTDQNGQAVTERSFAGKYRIMYFGYTFCPDVCPTDVQAIGAAVKKLEASDPALAAKIVPVFVTVDPARDTPAVLKQFVSAFHPRLVGLTGKGAGHTKANQIIIIDMNDVEDEVVELVSAVIARMLFRLLRRADPRNRFPIHLLLEEAHRYISATPSRYAVDATKIFERIAKEGRKYGMFVLLASQRPSELSKTVLSQCSNFLVHRIQNPDDLSQIRQMTPFISDSVLKRLPSLPRQHALVFGTSVNLPTTFKVREASPRPRSDDTAVVDLWFHEEGRAADIRIAPADTAGGEPMAVNEASDDDIF